MNTPIYSLIRKPNLYTNYEEYIDSVNTENDDIPKNAIAYDIPNALTYENTVVPYNDYTTYNDVTCSICDEVFQSSAALKRHQSSCKPYIYACNVCGKNVLTKNSLTRHVRAMHQTRKDIRTIEQKFT